MSNWTSPQTLALLGGAAGFLDPHGGFGAGFQGAMNGLMTGNELQHRKLIAEMQNQKFLRDQLARQMLQETLQQHTKNDGSIDHKGAINALMSSGMPELMAHVKTLQGTIPQYKAKIEATDENGRPVVKYIDSFGGVTNTGETPWKAPIKMDQGGSNALIDPVSMKPVAQYGKTISPGESARLAQSERHFGANYDLNRYKTLMPQYQNGQWISPPMPGQSQGAIHNTEYFTPPKGSPAEKSNLRSKIRETLSDDTPDLIEKSTGSYLGQARDFAGRVIGKSTEGSESLNQLKIRATTLAGNMPRFEGPQSDTDRQYYLEMAGDLANPSKTTQERMAAYNELLRIHSLMDENGSIIGSAKKHKSNSKKSYISPDGFSSRVKE